MRFAGRLPLTQLAWQDYELPVILLDGVFIEPEKLLPNACSPGASVCTLTPKGGATCAAVVEPKQCLETPSSDPRGQPMRIVLPYGTPDDCGPRCQAVPQR